MTTRLCCIEGCGQPHDARGWCSIHYSRWHRAGSPDGPLSLPSIQAARERIGGGIVATRCPRSFGLETRTGARVHFKPEFRQRTGSFKDRGSLNKLLLFRDEARRRGVVAASAGNHAQALAFHAARLGVPCTIVMPEGAPLIKVANTKSHGAQVFQTGQTLSDGLKEVDRIVAEDGAVPVHAFDDLAVIAGQGTMALEIVEQVPEVSTIVVPVGGGGMISGIAVAAKELRPGVRVVGVEAAASPGAAESLAAGEPVHVESADTLADGIAVKRIGGLAYPFLESLVDDVVLVSEREIADAVFFLLEQEKVVVEGAGATPVAALLEGKVAVAPGETVVCVLSGGNIDVNIISRIIDRGLRDDGRLVRLRVVVRDRPGSLAQLTTVVAAEGVNVLDIHHVRAFGDVSVGEVGIEIRAETRGREHAARMVEKLRTLGHRVEERP